MKVLKAHHAHSQVKIGLLTAKEGEAGKGELVIHHGIEHVALHPALGFGGDLADDVGFGIGGLDDGAEFLPEGIIINIKGHIQAPAVDALFNPIPGNIENKFPHLGVIGVEFRQFRRIPPTAVIGFALIGMQRVTPNVKPIQVGRLSATFENVIELEESPAGMVENTIQDNANIPAVGFFQQSIECGSATQQGVDLHVVMGVIAVVARQIGKWG